MSNLSITVQFTTDTLANTSITKEESICSSSALTHIRVLRPLIALNIPGYRKIPHPIHRQNIKGTFIEKVQNCTGYKMADVLNFKSGPYKLSGKMRAQKEPPLNGSDFPDRYAASVFFTGTYLAV